MDDIARFNVERWHRLAEADAPFCRPALDLDGRSARDRVDPLGIFGDVTGAHVLCLASGGGNQSAAFALLGASVTVLDLSVEQLERDRAAAAHYGKSVRTLRGDMRDISALSESEFDIVFQPYSLPFVPDPAVVFAQVARVLRPGGAYYLATQNPFTLGVAASDWDGSGYPLRLPYVHGAPVAVPDAEWVYARARPGAVPAGRVSREFRHTFAETLNALLGLGFRLLHVADSLDLDPEPDAQPGEWGHFVSIVRPWLAYWLRYEPE